jgi:hypothetical protein
VWSPDGKLLTVLAKTPDGKGIYIVRADGTGAYRIVATDPSGAYHVAGMRWENGNRLYFVTWTELGD